MEDVTLRSEIILDYVCLRLKIFHLPFPGAYPPWEGGTLDQTLPSAEAPELSKDLGKLRPSAPGSDPH